MLVQTSFKWSCNLGNNYIVFVLRVTPLPTIRCFETCTKGPAVVITALYSSHQSPHRSVAGIATRLRTVYNQQILVRFQVGARDSSCLQSVQTGSQTHPSSYSMGPESSFPGNRAAGS
jgi:hypothetical protein